MSVSFGAATAPGAKEVIEICLNHLHRSRSRPLSRYRPGSPDRDRAEGYVPSHGGSKQSSRPRSPSLPRWGGGDPGCRKERTTPAVGREALDGSGSPSREVVLNGSREVDLSRSPQLS